MPKTIHLMITQDADNLYSAIVLDLPGAGSSGETEEQAINNAIDALKLVIESYERNVPWVEPTIPSGARIVTIFLES